MAKGESSLISGAYAAAGGDIAGYDLAATKGLMGISEGISTITGNVIQARFKRFEKFADWELGRKEGTMTTPQYKKLQADLKRRRNEFIWAGKKDREMLMRELMDDKTEQTKLDEIRKQLAKYTKDNKSGLSDNWKSSKQGISVLDAFENGPTKNEETGSWEYEIYNPENDKIEMMTAEDVAILLKKNLRDGGTEDLINTLANSSATGADSSLPNDNGIFQYDQNYRNIKLQVVERGSYKSMVNDPDVLVDGRVFKDDLIEMIMDNTYGDLGISDRKITRLDKRFGKEEGITLGDAAIIAEKLLENERTGKKYLTTYVTNHLEKNWISENQNTGNTENISSSSNQSSTLKPTNGIYTDHDAKWDYRMVDGKWYTRLKTSTGNWIDISNNTEATNTLNTAYPDAGSSDAGSSDAEGSGTGEKKTRISGNSYVKGEGFANNDSKQFIVKLSHLKGDKQKNRFTEIIQDPNVSDEIKADIWYAVMHGGIEDHAKWIIKKAKK